MRSLNAETEQNPVLVAELMRVVLRFAGQSPSIETINRELRAHLSQGAELKHVPQYLQGLDDSLLMRLVRSMEQSPRGQQIIAKRAQVLCAAYAAHPERFVRGVPAPQAAPVAAWIYPPKPTPAGQNGA